MVPLAGPREQPWTTDEWSYTSTLFMVAEYATEPKGSKLKHSKHSNGTIPVNLPEPEEECPEQLYEIFARSDPKSTSESTLIRHVAVPSLSKEADAPAQSASQMKVVHLLNLGEGADRV
ncbi:hypothetical protein WOLCODRAFT_20611 [Wolfiporia cocos MD-104 SS10]|uniref:Uncharacterized protein n=1 Tax=Wolfiporia cocos (strain MD-104) TaxID=742152 RepID=A0A2H3JCV2_WOLCO|nr:hypothetical protein WOLCODRAFT_20611 [Wolfiporia cocos MD-104 SS10]